MERAPPGADRTTSTGFETTTASRTCGSCAPTAPRRSTPTAVARTVWSDRSATACAATQPSGPAMRPSATARANAGSARRPPVVGFRTSPRAASSDRRMTNCFARSPRQLPGRWPQVRRLRQRCSEVGASVRARAGVPATRRRGAPVTRLFSRAEGTGRRCRAAAQLDARSRAEVVVVGSTTTTRQALSRSGRRSRRARACRPRSSGRQRRACSRRSRRSRRSGGSARRAGSPRA